MRRVWPALLFFLCATLVLCAGCAKISSPSKPSAGGYQVTDYMGTVVLLPQKPERIISLNIASDEILLALVEARRIAALTYWSENPAISNVVELSRQVPAKIHASAESIVALQPDLVLMPDWQPVELTQTLRDMGIKVFVFGDARSIQDIRQSIRAIAGAVGEQEQGEMVIARMNQALQEVQDKLENMPEERRLIVARVSTMGGSGGAGTSFDDICRHAGVKNAGVLAGLDETASLSQEQLLQINPDLFLLPTWDFSEKTDMQKLRNEIERDPLLQSVKAVRNRRLIQIPDRYLFCTSQYIVEGVRQLAAAAYPDRFKAEQAGEKN